MALFQMGRLLATPGALETMTDAGISPAELLDRHCCGDWGDLDVHDRKVNNDALKTGERLLSSYRIALGVKVWIITEADRSVTTILLPQEY